jgi:hypothetical protein
MVIGDVILLNMSHTDGNLLARYAEHLALASFHNCDMLVTWNCKHLANANKFAHIHRVNALLGLRTPALVTPLQLLEKEDENET